MSLFTHDQRLKIIEGVHLACADFFIREKRLPNVVYIPKADFERLVRMAAGNDSQLAARSDGFIGVKVFSQFVTTVGHADLPSLTVSVV